MVANTKLISVIIPVHNRLNLFKACFRSIISQNGTSEDIEIIVVDDKSDPPISKYLKKIRRQFRGSVKIIRNSTVLGPALTRNRGLAVASGKFISFLDSDDAWRGSFIVESIKKIRNREKGVSICILGPKFKGKLSLEKKLFYLFLSLTRTMCFLVMQFLNHGELRRDFFYMIRLSGMVFSRKAIGKVTFESSYKSAEDWKFVYDCMVNNGSKIYIIPKHLADFSYHMNSETLGRSDYFKYYRRLIGEFDKQFRKTLGISLFNIYSRLR